MSICHLSSIRLKYPYLFPDPGLLALMDPSQHIAKANRWPAFRKSNSKRWLEMSPIWHHRRWPTPTSRWFMAGYTLPLWRSEKRKLLEPQWTGGHLWSLLELRSRHLPAQEPQRQKESRERTREHWHHVLCVYFLFLLSIRKWERGMWIEPLKDWFLSAFSPGGHQMERKREVFWRWGQGPGG